MGCVLSANSGFESGMRFDLLPSACKTETCQWDAVKLQGGRLGLHRDKRLSSSSSVGVELCPTDILSFALFVSDPPDPTPVPYSLTLPGNLSIGRMTVFVQYIIYKFVIKVNWLIACYKPVLNKTHYYHPHALLIKYLLEGCTGYNSMQ